MSRIDLLIRDATFFDGKGSPPRRCDLAIADGVVTQIGTDLRVEAAQVVQADGKWVMPGFIDNHTHYDAEIEVLPSLPESLRHGVTTVFMGSCSLSAAVGDSTDIADMFTRVEGIPYDHLLPTLKAVKTWQTHAEYVDHVNSLPLGPNVASFVGYSAVRAKVLGLERALDPKVRPTEAELSQMEACLHEGYDAGFLGLSLNGLYWDKMGGDRFRSKCLPSTYATWSELNRMVATVRQRDLNLQGIPNISTKYQVFAYLAWSAGFFVRKPLKVSMVSIMDLISNRLIWPVLLAIAWLTNHVLGGRFRYQFLPVPFDLWADGFENVVFEEFGAGAAGLHLETMLQRKELFSDPAYRRRFRRDWRNPLLPKVFHRKFSKATVVACPDSSVVGKTFAEIGVRQGKSETDAFLDLLVEHGSKLRWFTSNGNDRPGPVAHMMKSDACLLGFADSGAHLRNMAFYNFPLRALRFVKERAEAGRPVMPLEQLVYKLTGEQGAFFGIDAGVLEEGRRADLVMVDPAALDFRLDEIHDRPIAEFGGYPRLVRRNPDAVPLVLVNGRVAVQDGQVLGAVGSERGFGQFLKVGGQDSEQHAHQAVAK